MGKIVLEGMEFFAYHGFYDEEQKIGNKYTIDLEIWTNLQEAAVTDRLKSTISYEEVYSLVQGVMLNKHRLLEHVGYEIIQEVKTKYASIEAIQVSVSKHNPPVGGICSRAKIVLNA